MRSRLFTSLLILILVIVFSTVMYYSIFNGFGSIAKKYTYHVVNEYPHDDEAFTQGLVFDNGFIYEGTGLYGKSTVRCLELKSGKILQILHIENQFFGEGITIIEGEIIQLTWKDRRGFVYDKNSFELIEEFNYSTEGWGITYDGSHLIMSDSSSNLSFLDPGTYKVVRQIVVHEIAPVFYLNELEYIKGEIYANIWNYERIAIIDPQTGIVKGWVDMSGIKEWIDQDPDNVLNGIAYDACGDRLFVQVKDGLKSTRSN